MFTPVHAGIKALAILATSRPHEFLSDWSELFRPRSGRASDEVARSLGPGGVPPLQFFEIPLENNINGLLDPKSHSKSSHHGSQFQSDLGVDKTLQCLKQRDGIETQTGNYSHFNGGLRH